MKKYCFALVIILFGLLSGCATQKPVETYHSVQYVQPNIDPSLFEPSKVSDDSMTQEKFDGLTLSQRFTYLGQRIVNLQYALSIVNEQLGKIKNLYNENEKTLKGQAVQGSVLYWGK